MEGTYGSESDFSHCRGGNPGICDLPVLRHSGREEQAFLTSLAGLVLVLFWLVPYIYDLFETMKNLFAL